MLGKSLVEGICCEEGTRVMKLEVVNPELVNEVDETVGAPVLE